VCTDIFWPFEKCAHFFLGHFRSVHTFFSVFLAVRTSILWPFPESAHIFRGLVSRVRSFFLLLLKCAQFSPPCRPKFPDPGSGFRVLAGGSSCWRAATLIPQTFSLTAGEPAQPCAPTSIDLIMSNDVFNYMLFNSYWMRLDII
jgi:hypothetical protein